MASELPREILVAKKAAEPVPSDLREKAKLTVYRFVMLARQRHKRAFPMPTISFDLRGMVAGRAFGSRFHVQLNAVLFKENAADFLATVIPHEVAHLIARKLHGPKIGHGPQWQAIMREFGLQPDRTHSYDVTNAKTMRVYPYICKCDELPFSARRHGNVLRGASYICKKCHTVFTLKTSTALPKSTITPPTPKPTTSPEKTLTPPTERMLSYAVSLARKAKSAVPEEALKEIGACKAYIERMTHAGGAATTIEPQREAPVLVKPPAPPSVLPTTTSIPLGTAAPTERQLDYARSIAVRKKTSIPPPTLTNRQALSAWIEANK